MCFLCYYMFRCFIGINPVEGNKRPARRRWCPRSQGGLSRKKKATTVNIHVATLNNLIDFELGGGTALTAPSHFQVAGLSIVFCSV